MSCNLHLYPFIPSTFSVSVLRTTASEKMTTADVKSGIVYELHKQARKNFPRRKVYAKAIDELWQADLVEMKPYASVNNGKRYILTVIDVLSKFAWAVPVQTKTGKDVTAAMRLVFRLSRPRRPLNLHTDNGKEFYNEDFQKLMRRNRINHYSTFTHLKASVVERFNRTLKNWMWKEFGVQGSYKWIPILSQLLVRYNTRVHRTIGMKPIDVKKQHENDLFQKVNTVTKEGKKKFKPK